MMNLKNKITKQQLEKVNIADLSNFENGVYYIKQKKDIRLDVNKCYHIELDDILLQKENNEFAITYNKGVVPKNKCYTIDVSKNLGKLIYVNAIAYDKTTNQNLKEFWAGWLPLENIKVLERVD